jgi:uncharacterized membrane protein YfhO
MEETVACPIGFKVSYYITEEQLKEIPVESRAIALMQAAVVSKADTSKLFGIEKALDIDLSIPASDLALKAQENSVKDFYKDGRGFTCTSHYEDDSVVYFSVPYDLGWSATIDGQDSQIIESGGMMLLNIPAGDHSIEFSYTTPGYNTGMLISVICFLVFITICVSTKKKRPASH